MQIKRAGKGAHWATIKQPNEGNDQQGKEIHVITNTVKERRHRGHMHAAAINIEITRTLFRTMWMLLVTGCSSDKSLSQKATISKVNRRILDSDAAGV